MDSKLMENKEEVLKEAYEEGYKKGYFCVSESDIYSVQSSFAEKGEEFETEFNRGVSIGFIDKAFDMNSLDFGNTIH
jgi:hypothetical protein